MLPEASKKKLQMSSYHVHSQLHYSVGETDNILIFIKMDLFFRGVFNTLLNCYIWWR